MYNTELAIHEVGLSQCADAFLDQPDIRIDCLWACLQAVTAWMNVLTNWDPADYIGLSPFTYFSMAHCFTGMYRLSIFEHQQWDRELIRTQFDISTFARTVEQNFSKVKLAAGLDSDGSDDLDTFTLMASKIARVRLVWDPSTATPATMDAAIGSEFCMDFPMDVSDEDWLRDLVGPWS